MNWKLTLPNKETAIANLILLIASIIAMIGAVKYSSYSFGVISIILGAIDIKLKY
jgi:hypothetical protein